MDAAKGVIQDRHLCVPVTLNVSNAFNLAPWHLIDAAVAGFGAPQYIRRSYLSERTILVPSRDVVIERDMTCSVPQGSVFGQTLWNIFYDGLLRIGLPPGTLLVGFADDVALIVNHTTDDPKQMANDSLIKIERWINANSLQLAHAKTEAIMITRKCA